MDINALLHLKYVFAAAEFGSMRKVALALGVQESSVSRNILSLEQYLDLQLFDRCANGVRLTRAGRVWVEEIRAHYEGVEEQIARTALRNKDAKTIRIGVNPSIGQDFIVRLVRCFERSCPDIAVSIEDVAYRNHVHAIRRRVLDVAFMCGSCRARSCTSEVISEERLVVLLPAGHPMCDRSALSWVDLAGNHLLIPTEKDVPQFDPHLLSDITTSTECLAIQRRNVSQSTIFIDVQLGKGIAVAGESLARTMRIDHAVWRPLVGPGSVSFTSVVWLESNPKRAIFRLLAIAKGTKFREEAGRT
jgi:DNA-binding transcriptional LysR family regulator